MNQFSDAVGALIKWHRKRAKLTQGELAQLVGFTRTSISNMESGRQRIQLDTLYTIAKALEVDVSELLPQLPHHMAYKALRCGICRLDLVSLYGALTKGYIQAKHIRRRLKKISDEIDIDDGYIYCATCQEILELNPGLTIEEMRVLIKRNLKKKTRAEAHSSSL